MPTDEHKYEPGVIDDFFTDVHTRKKSILNRNKYPANDNLMMQEFSNDETFYVI